MCGQELQLAGSGSGPLDLNFRACPGGGSQGLVLGHEGSSWATVRNRVLLSAAVSSTPLCNQPPVPVSEGGTRRSSGWRPGGRGGPAGGGVQQRHVGARGGQEEGMGQRASAGPWPGTDRVPRERRRPQNTRQTLPVGQCSAQLGSSFSEALCRLEAKS